MTSISSRVCRVYNFSSSHIVPLSTEARNRFSGSRRNPLLLSCSQVTSMANILTEFPALKLNDGNSIPMVLTLSTNTWDVVEF